MAGDTVGAILVGGQSTRMGRDKAGVELAGKPLASWVAAALTAAGLEVITAGGPDRVPGYPNVADAPGVIGPLAGLVAALGYAAGRPVFLVATDQPLLRPATVRRIVAARGPHDAAVPLAAGHPQVTCAVYGPGCLRAIAGIAKPPATIRDLLTAVTVRYLPPADWEEWGEDGRSWRSLDSAADLAATEAELAEAEAAALASLPEENQ